MVRALLSPQLSVRMTRLLREIDVLGTSGDTDVPDVARVEHDSRRVVPGDLFVCLRGASTDGHEHAGEAVARGAVGIVAERPVGPFERPVPQALVAPGGARRAMALLAATLYGHPADTLLTVGVTGTSGKTTVVHLLGTVLEHAGHPTTVIGTMTGARTTPESTELQRLLAEARDEPRDATSGTPAVAMEVSSHALVQARVEGVRFDVAVFTNLSHEHLDFHGSMERYFAAKAMLFEPDRAKTAVVNADDPWGRRLLAGLRVPSVAVRLADLGDVVLEPGRSRFRWRDAPVSLALTGLLNVRNAQLAAEAAVALGLEPRQVAEALCDVGPVPGRMERVHAGDRDFDVFVDYAHKPGALEAVLGDARRIADRRGGRVLVVFGCAGERDPSKRPLMGEVAARCAHVAIVTSDNPRSEDPLAIIKDVVAGMPDGARIEPDRRRAIAASLREARAGDVVVLAGKGHETAQVLAHGTVPFDDRIVAAELLASGDVAAATHRQEVDGHARDGAR